MNPKPQMPPTAAGVRDLVRTTLGGTESAAYAYYDDDERHVVAVVEASGTPTPTLSSYATASLHATPNSLDGRDIRVELAFVVDGRSTSVAANILATAAFCVMKDGWLAAPGVVFPNAVRMYIPETTVPHLMWTTPFDFPAMSRLAVPALTEPVHGLQGVPLSDQEYDLLERRGLGVLEERLEASDAPHFDLYRASTC